MGDEYYSPEEESFGTQFTFSHLAIVAVCAFGLLSLTVMKSGFSFHINHVAATEQGSGLTYEQVLAKQNATQPTSTPATTANQNQDLAVLNPMYGQGDVLGASTEDIPSADELYSDEVLKKLWLPMTKDASKTAIQKYADQTLMVEAKHDALTMFATAMGDDVSNLQSISDESQKVVSELKAITVPEPLLRYHKLKIVFYTSVGALAKARVANASGDEQSTIGMSLLSLTDAIDAARTALATKYGVDL